MSLDEIKFIIIIIISQRDNQGRKTGTVYIGHCWHINDILVQKFSIYLNSSHVHCSAPSTTTYALKIYIYIIINMWIQIVSHNSQ